MELITIANYGMVHRMDRSESQNRRDDEANSAREVDMALVRREVEMQVRHEGQLQQIREKAEEHGLDDVFGPLTKSTRQGGRGGCYTGGKIYLG